MTTPETPRILALIMPNPHGSAPDHRENPLANLDFGPAGIHSAEHATTNIHFSETEPGVGRAFVREDHPLLPRLFEKYPMIRVDDGRPVQVFVCGYCDDREFGSRQGLRNHMRSHEREQAAEAEE
jgi:hypothetical protein